jgi:hypothetical protein
MQLGPRAISSTSRQETDSQQLTISGSYCTSFSCLPRLYHGLGHRSRLRGQQGQAQEVSYLLCRSPLNFLATRLAAINHSNTQYHFDYRQPPWTSTRLPRVSFEHPNLLQTETRQLLPTLSSLNPPTPPWMSIQAPPLPSHPLGPEHP